MNINLHEWLRLLLFTITSTDNTGLMKKLKPQLRLMKLPVLYCDEFSIQLNNPSAGGFGMASGETKNVSR